MNLFKRFFTLLLLVCLAGTAFALEFKGDGSQGGAFASRLNADNDLANIVDFPKKFIAGFGDASIFTSHGATQRSFNDYKTFAFTVGPMIGFRVPGKPKDAVDDLQNADTILKHDGDMSFGANAQLITGQIGINGKFLLENLNLGLRFGYFSIPLNGLDDMNVNFKSFHLGAVADYRIVKGADLGVIKWRGLTVGTGLLYQKTTLDCGFIQEDFREQVSGDWYIARSPSMNFNMSIRTFTIPAEISTSVLLLKFLNIGVGAGVDFAFGSNDTSINLSTRIEKEVGGADGGSVWLTGGGAANVKFFNPKVMADVGLKLGPVVLDVPITYYFGSDSGVSLGVTLGIVF